VPDRVDVRAGHVACTSGSKHVKTSYPTHPPHPERVCWGCDRLCSASDLVCGSDTVRTPHPVELFGDDWNVSADDEVPVVLEKTHLRVVGS
jgi:hypothetical protein